MYSLKVANCYPRIGYNNINRTSEVEDIECLCSNIIYY